MTPLSPRQLELLRLIALGHRRAAIARIMGISPETAKNHAVMMRLKLRATTNAHAVTIGIRAGLIDADAPTAAGEENHQ